jgi:hypothetical protein
VVSTSPGTPLVADQRAHLVGQRLREPAVLQRLGPQRLDRTAGLGQAVPGEPLGVADPPLALGVVAGLLGRLELGDDPGQALRERVVDLPRHPLPLVPRARLPSLGEQLGLQPGVLRDHLFQPLVRLGELGDHALPGLILLFGFLAKQDEDAGEHDVDTPQEHPDRHRRYGRPVESPHWAMPKKIATAAQAAHRHAPARYRSACRKPIQVKNANHGLRMVSTAMNATRPVT